LSKKKWETIFSRSIDCESMKIIVPRPNPETSWQGKRIYRWNFGEVLSKVAGTDEWYNVKYKDEDDVLTINLYKDMDLGDLEVV